MQVAFSFHYLELLRIKKIDTFFENVNYVKSLGCSILVQVNLYDDYLPYMMKYKSCASKKLEQSPNLQQLGKSIL
jgi:hypothetical protein